MIRLLIIFGVSLICSLFFDISSILEMKKKSPKEKKETSKE